MKKKIIFLMLTLALLCMPLAACGGVSTTKKIKITNYTVGLDYSLYGEPSFTEYELPKTAKELAGTITATNGHGLAVVKTGSDASSKYKLYNIDSDTYLLSNAEYDNITFSHGLAVAYINADSAVRATVCDLSGMKTLLPLGEWQSLPTVSTANYYLPDKYTQSTVYKITYRPLNEEEDLYKYFSYESPDGISAKVFREVNPGDLRVSAVNPKPGSSVQAASATPLYTETAGRVYPAMSSYTLAAETISSNYGIMRMTYTFFKNGSECGKLNIENGYPITMMENYLYYAELEELAYDAKKGYNVYLQQGSDFTNSHKYKVTYYKYDVKKNKSKKFDPGCYVMAGVPLYNYSKQCYDAAQIAAVEYEDGVANVTSYTIPKTFVVNSKFKVGFDLSNKPFSVEEGGVRLNSDRFLFNGDEGAYITDSKLNVVASFHSDDFRIYKNSGLIVYQNGNNYMAVDFNGKIALQPKYSSLDLYGGYAYTDVKTSVDNVNEGYIVSVGNPDGVDAASQKLNGTGEYFMYTANGLLVKYDGTGTVKVYNYEGTEISGINGSTFGFVASYKGKAIITTSSGSVAKSYVLS